MAKSRFNSELKKGLSKDLWNKARKSTDTGGYRPPDIEDGSYVCHLSSIRCSVIKTTPTIRVGVVVARGDYEGTQLSTTHWLDESSDRYVESLERVVGTLKICDPDLVDMIESMDLDEFIDSLDAMCQEVTKLKPLLRCSVKNWLSETTGKKGINIVIDELLSDETCSSSDPHGTADGPWEDDDEEESDDEEDGDQELDDTKGEGDAEEDEEEKDGKKGNGRKHAEDDEVDDSGSDGPIVAGDFVEYKPPRARKPVECQVVTSNKRKRVASLKEVDGDRSFVNVSWDELELFDYED